LQDREGKKTNQWWLYVLVGSAILALAAYVLQPYFK